MASNIQFSIAVHLMVELCCQFNRSATSTRLAESVNTHPSFVRRIVAKLAKANLVRTTTGKSGTVCVERDTNSLSLRDIYKAMEGPKAFSVQPNHNQRKHHEAPK